MQKQMYGHLLGRLLTRSGWLVAYNLPGTVQHWRCLPPAEHTRNSLAFCWWLSDMPVSWQESETIPGQAQQACLDPMIG